MNIKKSGAIRCKLALLLAGLALLCGCDGEQQAERDTPASVSPELPAQMESAPASPLMETTPEELLAQQPVDDDHDAFLVDTGGRMGTLVVTAELGEQVTGSELGNVEITLSVWDPQAADVPIQTMTAEIEPCVFGTSGTVDANFDGYTDFWHLYFSGNQPTYAYFWLWDEARGQFVEEPALAEICCPEFDGETEIISGYSRNGFAGLAGTHTFHRWIDGELVCVRRVETCPEGWELVSELVTVTVEELADGALTEVFRENYDTKTFLQEVGKWCDLAYHGE